jgi:hypothetical protein
MTTAAREPLFLEPQEVEVLTGFKSLARQVGWLRTKGSHKGIRAARQRVLNVCRNPWEGLTVVFSLTVRRK